LILLGHGENSIFDIHNELLLSFPGLNVVPVIADIRDGTRVLRAFDTYRPQVVFHTAAHKHVPLMELNPEEAVTNNVLGTANVLSAAERTGVSRFVFISTDKAVNPVNVMGATKLLAEMLVHDAALRTGAPYVSVRFGNVLASRGSVVPLFKRQILAGGPLTVTHPDMCRYFMTIPEAVQLVMQAAALGRGGETFLLDMGEPVKIVDLAKDLIHLSGLEEGKDINIVFTGLRPGEKIFEVRADRPREGVPAAAEQRAGRAARPPGRCDRRGADGRWAAGEAAAERDAAGLQRKRAPHPDAAAGGGESVQGIGLTGGYRQRQRSVAEAVTLVASAPIS
jgi:FlaA1/EpsC-like NDP-sugar epimerase